MGSVVEKLSAERFFTPYYHGRKLLQAVLPRVFPYEFVDFPGNETFGRIVENIRNGKCTIVCLTHFDKGEVPALTGMFAQRLPDEILASKVKIVLAASYHQKQAAVLGLLGSIDMAWIVNEDTMNLERAKQEKETRHGVIFSQKAVPKIRLGMGLKEFAVKAQEAIYDKNGGLVFVALQAGRRPKLGEPVGVLSLLLRHVEKDKPDIDYDVLIIGSVLKDVVWETGDWETGSLQQFKSWAPVKSYVGRNGFNMGSLHEFRAGPIIKRRELMEKLGGNLRNADKWAFEIIRHYRLVDEVYF